MMKKKTNKKHDQTKEYKMGWQRCLADFENYRKRVELDKKDWQRFAQTELILELLPVLDNFELALNHLSEVQKKDPAIAGIFHIQKQLIDVMTGIGIEKIAAAPGDQFDPNLHEAVESHEGKGGDVIHSIHRHGYKIGDKVLRPTKVTVR